MRLGGRSPDSACHAWRNHQHLGTSHSVCPCLDALSLSLSLARDAIVDCQNNDHGAGFCDPHLDNLASQTRAAQLTDPAAWRLSSSAGLVRLCVSS